MSIFDSIKGTRKLSFNHWRYRLLHWCFNVKNPNPDNISATNLPRYLYTHYCPLFHLTNLIAIFSPMILLFKVFLIVFGAFISAVKVISWNFDFVRKLFAKIKTVPDEEKKEAQYVASAKTKAKERLEIIDLISKTHPKWNAKDFWLINNCVFGLLSEEEVTACFNEYVPKFIEARKEAEKRKEDRKKTMLFWTNFSRVFVQWSLNVFYFLLSIGALYFMYIIAQPLWNGLCWLVDAIIGMFSNVNNLETLLLVLKLCAASLLWAIILYVLAKIGFLQRFGRGVAHGLSKLVPPFYLIDRFFRWIGRGFLSVKEFVMMFYEENCPPIVIVSQEQEKVEQVANNDITGE
jgi:hypothetical protein